MVVMGRSKGDRGSVTVVMKCNSPKRGMTGIRKLC